MDMALVAHPRIGIASMLAMISTSASDEIFFFCKICFS